MVYIHKQNTEIYQCTKFQPNRRLERLAVCLQVARSSRNKNDAYISCNDCRARHASSGQRDVNDLCKLRWPREEQVWRMGATCRRKIARFRGTNAIAGSFQIDFSHFDAKREEWSKTLTYVITERSDLEMRSRLLHVSLRRARRLTCNKERKSNVNKVRKFSWLKKEAARNERETSIQCPWHLVLGIVPFWRTSFAILDFLHRANALATTKFIDLYWQLLSTLVKSLFIDFSLLICNFKDDLTFGDIYLIFIIL